MSTDYFQNADGLLQFNAEEVVRNPDNEIYFVFFCVNDGRFVFCPRVVADLL